MREAGINLCEYVMPGVGGRQRSKEHARETARVINAIQPDFIRLRSLHLQEGMPLLEKVAGGRLQLQTEDEVVEEIRAFVDMLDTRSETQERPYTEPSGRG